MSEVVLTIFIFVGVMSVTVLLFGGWVLASIIRMIGRAIFGSPVPRETRSILNSTVGEGQPCPNQSCRQTNPQPARFCRRCGTALPDAQRVNVRRAAMW